MNKEHLRLIAYYLPQFHPIPENDRWWGKGFTEWTNTAKAKPMFKGHYQPHVPADLGFYDLRLPESRLAQAEMASRYGIEGFCYYHYWFSGKQIIERPFNEVLSSGSPDFPFCLCWANQTWSGIWHGEPKRVLIEQAYPGRDDHINHFTYLLKAFSDERYILIDGKPLFMVFRPFDIPDVRKMTDLWRELALKSGLKGLYLIGLGANQTNWDPLVDGFDAMATSGLPAPRPWVSRRKPLKWLKRQLDITLGKPTVYSYEKLIEYFLPKLRRDIVNYPTIIPNWDNTPRSGVNGIVLNGSTPELFRKHVVNAINYASQLKSDSKIIFIKSWNEWAEGNHLEPDLRYGTRYLEVLNEECSKFNALVNN